MGMHNIMPAGISPSLPPEKQAPPVSAVSEYNAGVPFPPASKTNIASDQDLRQVILELEDMSLSFNRRLKFELDRDSHQIVVKVIDIETDKVIRVLPPEELQRLHSGTQEALGLIFNEMI